MSRKNTRSKFAIPSAGLVRGKPTKTERRMTPHYAERYLKAWGSRPESKRRAEP